MAIVRFSTVGRFKIKRSNERVFIRVISRELQKLSIRTGYFAIVKFLEATVPLRQFNPPPLAPRPRNETSYHLSAYPLGVAKLSRSSNSPFANAQYRGVVEGE